jgi:hypothetical protein
MVYVPLPAPLVSVLSEPEEQAVALTATAKAVSAATVRRHCLEEAFITRVPFWHAGAEARGGEEKRTRRTALLTGSGVR